MPGTRAPARGSPASSSACVCGPSWGPMASPAGYRRAEHSQESPNVQLPGAEPDRARQPKQASQTSVWQSRTQGVVLLRTSNPPLQRPPALCRIRSPPLPRGSSVVQPCTHGKPRLQLKDSDIQAPQHDSGRVRQCDVWAKPRREPAPVLVRPGGGAHSGTAQGGHSDERGAGRCLRFLIHRRYLF